MIGQPYRRLLNFLRRAPGAAGRCVAGQGWLVLLAAVLSLAAGGCDKPAPPREAPRPGASADGPALVRVTGQVERDGATDHGGIQVYLPGTSQVALTDGQGRYALADFGPGSYLLMARADGYQPTTVSQLVIDASTHQSDLVLPTVRLKPLAGQAAPTPAQPGVPVGSGVLRGRVSSASVPTGTVYDWSHCSLELEGTAFRTQPDARGDFLFWSLPVGHYRLLARLDGFAPYSAPVEVLAAPTESTALVDLLATGGTSAAANARSIRGFVSLVRLGGQPGNDFDRVVVEVLGRPDLTATLAPDGTFTLPPVPPGVYKLLASAEGYQRASPLEVDVTTLPEMEVQLTLTAGAATAEGHVRLRGMALKNVDGETDMSGITVALAGTGLMAVTDRDGNFVIDRVTSGSFTLMASAEGYQQAEAEVEVGADSGEVEAPSLLLEPKLDRPRVVNVEPPDGARDLVIRREIPLLVHFSKKMDPASLANGIQIEPEVAWKVSLVERDTAEILLSGWGEEPVATFNTRYRVTLSTDVQDEDSLGLEAPYHFGFSTGKPSVVESYPENGDKAAELSLATAALLRFNAPMDPATLTPDQLRISPRLSSEPVLSVATDPQTGWSTLQIRGDWKAGTQYRVTLERRARTINKDSLSNTPYTFSFRTVKMKTHQQPQRPRSGSSGGRN